MYPPFGFVANNRQSIVFPFFIGWVKAGMESGTVCYDVTSISSYARQMSSTERGYNRDGENLAQFNIGMFCDENYNRYNGSLTDKTKALTKKQKQILKAFSANTAIMGSLK